MSPRLSMLALGLLLAGCARPAPPPTELLMVVREPSAPGLTSPKKTGLPVLMGHQGDVYRFEKSWGPFEWEGKIDGKAATRKSELLQLKRSRRDSIAFLFEQDMIQGVAVPTTDWFCSTAPRPQESGRMPCADMMMRIMIDNETMAGYLPCAGGPSCLLGLSSFGKPTWVEVPNLLKVQQRRVSGRPLLVVQQGRNEGNISGTNLLILGAEPGLPRLLLAPDEVVDGSAAPTMRYRSVEAEFQSDALVLSGTERELNATTGQELSSRPVREVYRLGRKGFEPEATGTSRAPRADTSGAGGAPAPSPG